MRLEGAEVALKDNAAAMQDRDAIRIGLLESSTECNRPPVHCREFHATKVPLGTGQHRCQARIGPDPDCRHELADIAPRRA
jgi:hypothetical protein